MKKKIKQIKWFFSLVWRGYTSDPEDPNKALRLDIKTAWKVGKILA